MGGSKRKSKETEAKNSEEVTAVEKPKERSYAHTTRKMKCEYCQNIMPIEGFLLISSPLPLTLFSPA